MGLCNAKAVTDQSRVGTARQAANKNLRVDRSRPRLRLASSSWKIVALLPQANAQRSGR
jgi:hypothetical protein